MISKFRTILIEDNPTDAKLIQHMLKASQVNEPFKDLFEIKWFDCLSEGLEYIKNSQVDIILLDLSLPDSEGLHTFQQAQREATAIPIIVLTGLDDEKVAIDAVHAGAQDYLIKSEVDRNLLFRSMRYAIERKRVEEEKEKMIHLLLETQKMEAVGNLAGGIAHDFNNLMTTIQGFTDVLMMKVKESDPFYNSLKQIRIASSNAAVLTNQMLLFSRRHPVKFIILNLNKLIDDLMKMLNRVLGEDITIKTDLQSDLYLISADQSTLEQLIINLAVYAKDGMPKGGRIIIKSQNLLINDPETVLHPDAEPGKFICLSMIDNGLGIDQETLAHIFEPFYHIERVGHSTGLSMAAVYGIVKQHRGWIDVVSELDRGTTFKIVLPAVNKNDDLKAKEEIKSTDSKPKGKRILVIEDSEGVREFLVLALSENGFKVQAVSNGREALNVFERENMKFEYVLSDVVLPDMSGIELIEKLLIQKPVLKVLLCSGYTDNKLQWPIIQEKGYSFLDKPFTYQELLQAVKKAFD